MLKVGDKVRCRLYNLPSRKRYDYPWTGEIKEIDEKDHTLLLKPRQQQRRYTVTIKLTRREILRKI